MTELQYAGWLVFWVLIVAGSTALGGWAFLSVMDEK